MVTYKIIATSWVLWILTFLVTLLCGSLLLHELLPRDPTVVIFAVVGLLAFAIFIQRFISRAEVQVILNDHSISIRWIKQFILHNRPDREIDFSEIESYKFQEDTNFDLFKLTLTEGTSIKLWHFTFTHGDDFDKLMADFPIKVNLYNKQASDKKNVPEKTQNEHTIARAKTIFESAFAPFLAILAILMILAIPVILYIMPSGNSKNPFVLLAPLAGAVFFLTQYFNYRRKKKSNRTN